MGFNDHEPMEKHKLTIISSPFHHFILSAGVVDASADAAWKAEPLGWEWATVSYCQLLSVESHIN